MNQGGDKSIHFREFLTDELARRCKQNPRYSLRAFSRSLGITPAGLSYILSGKRIPSLKTARQLAKRLALDQPTEEAFVNSCLKGFMADPKNQPYNQMSLDQFAMISEWYHFAILSLLETKDFVPSESFVASRLGISLAESKAAVQRLMRLGILDTSGKKWKQIGAAILVENTKSTVATRLNQKQILEKAIYSIENDEGELRDISSMTIAIDPKLIPLAREKIKKFRIYLMNLLEGKKNPREVYHLAVQIYPVSRIQKD